MSGQAALGRHPRRAQMEMIGVVFVVVILVLGIVLYMAFSGPARSNAGVVRSHGSSTLLTALGKTEVPECGVSVTELAAECAKDSGTSTFCGGQPCKTLQRTLATVLDRTDFPEQYKYNLSVTGTSVQNESRCPSARRDALVEREASTLIPLGNGDSRNLTLAMCR